MESKWEGARDRGFSVILTAQAITIVQTILFSTKKVILRKRFLVLVWGQIINYSWRTTIQCHLLLSQNRLSIVQSKVSVVWGWPASWSGTCVCIVVLHGDGIVYLHGDGIVDDDSLGVSGGVELGVGQLGGEVHAEVGLVVHLGATQHHVSASALHWREGKQTIKIQY